MSYTAKGLLTFSAISHILGPFVADFNETHVRNPNWPPHARFHNGQTMSMGAGLGLLILHYTWRSANKGRGKKDDFLSAALVGSIYFGAALTAIFYPGSSGVDPEFRHLVSSDFPQKYPFIGLVLLGWAAYGVERVWGSGAKAVKAN